MVVVSFSFPAASGAATAADDVDGRTKPEITPLLWVVVCFSAMTGFLMGFDLSIIAVVLNPIQAEFKLCLGEQYTCLPRKLFVSIIAVGALVGSLSGGWLADYLGRRYTLALSDICFAIGSLFFLLGTTFSHMIVGRVIVGVGIGIGFVVFSTYMAEIAPPASRGRLLLCQEIAQCFGVLFTYFVATILGDRYWKKLLSSAGIVATIQLLGITILPESPRWLCMQGRREEAYEIMSRLNMDKTELEEGNAELLQQKTAAATNTVASLLWDHKKEMATACFVGIAQNMLCLNAAQYYSTDLFYLAQVCKPYEWGMALGGVKLLGTTAAFSLVDDIGRRSLLLAGTVGIGCVDLLLALAYQLSPMKDMEVAAGYCHSAAAQSEMSFAGLGGRHSVTMVTGMLLLIFFWELSWAGLMYVVASEIIPSSIRGIGMGIVIFCFWVSHFISQLLFETGFHIVTIPGTFMILSGIALVIWITTYACVPDMTGKSLEAIRKMMVKEQADDNAPLMYSATGEQAYGLLDSPETQKNSTSKLPVSAAFNEGEKPDMFFAN